MKKINHIIDTILLEDIERKKNYTILKLKKIVKLGHIPTRENEPYDDVVQGRYTYFSCLANCFEHACYNLSNYQLKRFSVADADVFGFYMMYGAKTNQDLENSMLSFIKETGLNIEETDLSTHTNSNQWKVSLYFNNDYDSGMDFHWLLQERDGSWSGKLGFSDSINKFKTLPEICNDYYTLYNTYIITNPYTSNHKHKSLQEKDKQL